MTYAIIVAGACLLGAGQVRASTLYSIENYHESESSWPERNWKDWRVVSVDPDTGSLIGITGWMENCGRNLHPLGNCGSNNAPLAVLYNDDYHTEPQSRTVMLTTQGSGFDLVKQSTVRKYAFPAAQSGAKMIDMNDGFAFAAKVDSNILNQVSFYAVQNVAPAPIFLDHIATLVLDPKDLVPPAFALAAGCNVKMAGGCNVPSSMLYASVGDYGSSGGLFVISRGNGTSRKVPVSGIHASDDPFPTDLIVDALWVDVDVHPQTKAVLAGRRHGVSNTTFYEVDLASGASRIVLSANLGDIDGCAAYDNAARKWYLGCQRITTVSVDTWEASTGQAVQHKNGWYSLSGLQLLLDRNAGDEEMLQLASKFAV